MKTDYPIARELLNAELARLLVDHFDDNETATCASCKRAYATAVELRKLHANRKGVRRHV